jgi:hypothetical protein
LQGSTDGGDNPSMPMLAGRFGNRLQNPARAIPTGCNSSRGRTLPGVATRGELGPIVEHGGARRGNLNDNRRLGGNHCRRIGRTAIHHDVRISNRIWSGLDGRVARCGATPLLLSDRDKSRLNVAAYDVMPFFGDGHGVGYAAYEFYRPSLPEMASKNSSIVSFSCSGIAMTTSGLSPCVI